jgi:predicted nucleic acid-binding protein
MIVVSDTSPLNYLILIGADQVLPSLFGQVVAPPEVLVEMQHVKAPAEVSAWARQPPAWLEVRSAQEKSQLPAWVRARPQRSPLPKNVGPLLSSWTSAMARRWRSN